MREYLKENLPELLEASLYGMNLNPLDPFSFYLGREDLPEIKKRNEVFARCVEPVIENYLEENYVTCERCGALIKKEKAEVVRVMVQGIREEELFYCKNCKPNYDEIVIEQDKDDHEIKKYYKANVLCDEKGKLIKGK